MISWFSGSKINQFADEGDLSGLTEAIRLNDIAVNAVESQIVKACKNLPPALDRALFFTVALIRADARQKAVSHLKDFLARYRYHYAWQDLEVQDIVNFLDCLDEEEQRNLFAYLSVKQMLDIESGLNVQQSLVWIETGLERCASAFDRLILPCRNRIKKLDTAQRQFLWQRGQQIRPELAIWYVIAGASYPDLLDDLLPGLVNTNPGVINWDIIPDEILRQLVELLKQHKPILLQTFMTCLNVTRFSKSMNWLDNKLKRSCLTKALECDHLREVASSLLDELELSIDAKTTAQGFLDSFDEVPSERNLQRLHLLLKYKLHEAADFTDKLLSLPQKELLWENLPHEALRRLVHIMADRPYPGRLMRILSDRQLTKLVDDENCRVRAMVVEYLLASNRQDDCRLFRTLEELWKPLPPTTTESNLFNRVCTAVGDTFRELDIELRELWRDHLRNKSAPDKDLLDVLADKFGCMPLRQAVVVSRLLSLKPDGRWQEILTEVWLQLEKLSSRISNSRLRHEMPNLWDSVAAIVDHACFAVVDALAKCTIANGLTIDFREDEKMCEQIRKIDEDIKPILDKYRKLCDKYNELLKRLKVLQHNASSDGITFNDPMTKLDFEMLRIELEPLEEQIVSKSRKREELWRMIQPELSPAWLLLSVVRGSQHHAEGTVQAAIGGLQQFVESDILTEDTAQKIRDSLIAVLSPDSASRFRERLIRLLPDADQTEVAFALEEGLKWILGIEQFMKPDSQILPESRRTQEYCPTSGTGSEAIPVSLHEDDDGAPLRYVALRKNEEEMLPSRIIDNYSPIKKTVQVLLEQVPQVLQFLEKYPLRLMMIRDLKGAFGVYTKSGAEIELWYRYDRPQEQGGKVSHRYLRLDNRMKPNSIGIDYRLLQHPLLFCPVLFHEMLHYGGLEGNPSKGIANELHVLLCEIAFAKGLLAKLAPVDDIDIQEYEQRLVGLCERTEAQGLFFQYLDDLSSAEILKYYNVAIPLIYRSQQDPEMSLLQQNLRIRLANLHLTWCAWIRWPELRTKETHYLTKEYLRLRQKHHEQDHTVSEDQRDQVLDTALIRGYLKDWNRYTGRPGTLEILKEARYRFESSRTMDPTKRCHIAAVRLLELLPSI